jgi:hypothetical protein
MAERFRFERELADLGVREYSDGPPAREVAVGERIVVDVKDTAYASYPLVKVRWDVPGTRVKAYAATRKKAAVTDLLPADLEQPKVAFHWVDAKKGREVRATITYRAGGSETTATVVAGVFDVHAPKLDHFRAETKKVALIKRGQLRGFGFGGVARGTHGIHWDWKVSMPARHGGWIKDVQTVRENRGRTRKDGKTLGRRNPAKKDLHEQLDQSLWDAGDEPTYSAKGHYGSIAFPTEVKAGKAIRDTETWDSPHTSLEPTDASVSVHDQFRYYILYKPRTAGAIWVPVARAEWFWKATAVRDGTGWKLTGAEGKVTESGRVTTDFPRYDSNVSYNKWVELP